MRSTLAQRLVAIALILAATFFVVSQEAVAQAIIVPNCNVSTTPPAYTTGTTRPCSQTTGGAQRVESSGNVASGATDSGNPVKVGGVYRATKPTLADGQRGDVQVGTRGAVAVQLQGVDSANGIAESSVNGDGASASGFGLLVDGRLRVFNGSTADRVFACTNNAQAIVTAGNTTQIVALASSQIIRVCSAHIGIATTGTYSFVYGTGANCATGTTTIIPATNLTAGNVVSYGDGNAAVMRTIASNALCVAAVTGNVQVQITYAQY